ncbi:MAG: hypothetical protein EXR98_00430 [Gemmataceae bacterium]|nr:hypothetical protein [Gemmataceae bacterium]
MTAKHANGVPLQGVQLGLIITPMLDMSFQILAFFIMTYHPSALERNIQGLLAPPEARKGDGRLIEDDLLAEAPPVADLAAAVTVKVRAVMPGNENKTHALGTLAQIFVRSGLDVEAELVADTHHDLADALKLLDKRLKEMLGNASGKASVKIAPDGDLRQEYVMAIYDTCRAAGYGHVHFVPPPVLNTKLK